MDYLGIILLIVLGLAMLLKPESIWKIDHFLSVKNGEPTELYLAFTRLSGLFFVGIGIIALVISFITMN